MAQKKQTIVIKKIIVQGGGHHGGSWKVALADFMTAMMAFFLVMWLLGQSEETKKAVSDYFSTPSVVEYNFQNFGAEITLEKLFLDLVNEPLKAIQSFVEPADKSPNIIDMGSSKVIAAFMADKMTDIAKNVNLSQDGFDFDIPDTFLFEKGSADPNKEFIKILNQLTQVTSGLQESEITIISTVFVQSVPGKTEEAARKIAQGRLDLIRNKIRASFENNNNIINDSTAIKDKKGEVDPEKLVGYIHIGIHQKEINKKEKPVKKQDPNFSERRQKPSATPQVSASRPTEPKKVEAPSASTSAPRALSSEDPNLKPIANPVDLEMQNVEEEARPGKIQSTTIEN